MDFASIFMTNVHCVNVHVVPHTVLLLPQPREILQQSGQQLWGLVILLYQCPNLTVDILSQTVSGIVTGGTSVGVGCQHRVGSLRPPPQVGLLTVDTVGTVSVLFSIDFIFSPLSSSNIAHIVGSLVARMMLCWIDREGRAM